MWKNSKRKYRNSVELLLAVTRIFRVFEKKSEEMVRLKKDGRKWYRIDINAKQVYNWLKEIEIRERKKNEINGIWIDLEPNKNTTIASRWFESRNKCVVPVCFIKRVLHTFNWYMTNSSEKSSLSHNSIMPSTYTIHKSIKSLEIEKSAHFSVIIGYYTQRNSQIEEGKGSKSGNNLLSNDLSIFDITMRGRIKWSCVMTVCNHKLFNQ